MHMQMGESLGNLLAGTSAAKSYCSSNWHQEEATTALERQLFQTLLDRVLRLAQALPGHEMLKEAVQHQVLDEQYNWPYLSWDPDHKKMKISAEKPITMQKMQKLAEELVELATQEIELTRFKCLKLQEMELTSAKISPWLIQLSLRQDRLHELLHLLTGNSVWMLNQGRLRPHHAKQNQLATALSKASSSLSKHRR